MKKKIALLIIVVMLLQLLAGCSVGKAQQSASGKKTDKVLKLGVVAKGYGDEYVKQLAIAFEKKTGIKTEVSKSSVSGDWVGAQLLAGESINDIDVFFDIRNNAVQDVAKTNYLKGYERAYVDLSDIYNKVPEGYDTDKTLKELVDPYSLKAVTWDYNGEGFGDGKQYFVSYMAGVEGIVYNKKLFEKYKLEIPRTTTEYFALLDQMKKLDNGTYAKNEYDKNIYPFGYSGKVNYMNFLARVWWAQYEGIDAYNRVFEGKDAAGNYSADSYKAQGKLSALNHMSRLLAEENGYTDPSCYSINFTDAQVLFMTGNAFMMVTGDWMEREMQGNFSGSTEDFAFMRIPVNSDIIKKCDSIKTEAQLVEVIDYIDGTTTTRPAYLSDADLARVSEASSVYSSEANQHIAYIPAYSNKIEDAKKFLEFMVSKEGQEVVMKYSFGNMAPLKVDVSKFEGYAELSYLQKSKYDMLLKGSGLSLIGQIATHPMAYASGCSDFGSAPTMETAFAVIKSSGTYKTPVEYWMLEYDRVATTWSSKLQSAGVK